MHLSKLAATLILSLWPVSSATLGQDGPSLEQILGRSLERARWYREEDIEERFAARLARLSEKLNGEGEVEESERLEYQIEPLREYPGHVFERLVRKDGEPLNEKEAAEEEEKREKLIRELAKGKDPRSEEENRVEYDEKLVSRYDFRLAGHKQDRGRTVHVLEFEPKSDNLPVEKRIDRALNKAEGEIWVDSETYEVARVSFRLREKVNIGWGIIGSFGNITGEINRRPVAGELWMPDEIRFYLNGRIFFANLHRRETLTWRDFQFVEAEGDELVRGPAPEPPQTAAP